MNHVIINQAIAWAVPFLCCALAAGMTATVRSYRKQTEALNEGVKSLLRAEIIRSYEKYTEKGYCPIYARDPLDKMYNAYHELGGNSTATDLYNKTIELPVERKAV